MPHGEATLALAWHNRRRQCARWDAMGREPYFTAYGTTATDGYPTKPEANRHQFCAVAEIKARKSFINWRRYSKQG
ncbi:hypothetical protein ACVXHB_21970 [Escherichia coli]